MRGHHRRNVSPSATGPRGVLQGRGSKAVHARWPVFKCHFNLSSDFVRLGGAWTAASFSLQSEPKRRTRESQIVIKFSTSFQSIIGKFYPLPLRRDRFKWEFRWGSGKFKTVSIYSIKGTALTVTTWGKDFGPKHWKRRRQADVKIFEILCFDGFGNAGTTPGGGSSSRGDHEGQKGHTLHMQM